MTAGWVGTRRFVLWAMAGLFGLALVKFWPMVRPQDRAYFGMDLSLGIEGYFYALLKRGVLYLWDPTIATGNLTIGGGLHHPQYAQALFHLFYPPSVLVFGLAERKAYVPHIVLVWYQIGHFIASGAFTVLYVRSLGTSRAGAFLAGMTFMLSAFLVAHTQHWLLVATVAWLPLALYCLRRAMRGPSLAWGVFSAIPLAMSFMGGHPQGFLYVLTAVGLAFAFALGEVVVEARGFQAAWRSLAPRLAAFGLATVVACALGALLLLPLLDLQIWTRQPPEVYTFDWKAQGSLVPHHLVKILLPNVMNLVGGMDHSETGLYLGVLPLLLALLGALAVRARAVYFHAGLAVLGLLLALGNQTPFFRLVYDLVPGYASNRFPVRVWVLVAFALAVLAGFGADVLFGAPDPTRRRTIVRAARALQRVLGGVAMLTAVSLSALFFLVDDVTRVRNAQPLVIDLVVFSLLLVASLGVLRVAASGATRLGVAGLTLAVAAVDLLFWSQMITTGDPRSADDRLKESPDIIAFLKRDQGPFRLGMADTAMIATYHLYRNGWSVYDEEDRLLPPHVQDLFFLSRKNPRILDMLGVKYIIGGKHGTLLTKYPTLDVTAEVPDKDLPIALPGPVRTVTLASFLVDGRAIAQGTPVATIALDDPQGTITLMVRAGIESAEWAWDHPFEPQPRHEQGTVVQSWPAKTLGFESSAFQGHTYGATWRLERPIHPSRVRLRYLLPQGSLALSSLRLDTTELTTLSTRFRQVHRLIEENRHVLPRAYLVPAVSFVPERAQRLARLERFDPEREALVSGVPPDVDLGPLARPAPLEPGEQATLLRAAFDRVEVRARVVRPRLLVVSDTWSRWWRATDNGRPVPILVANNALRGVVLGPGAHDIIFEFRYPIFPVALSITVAGWVAVAATAVLCVRARGSRRTKATPTGPNRPASSSGARDSPRVSGARR